MNDIRRNKLMEKLAALAGLARVAVFGSAPSWARSYLLRRSDLVCVSVGGNLSMTRIHRVAGNGTVEIGKNPDGMFEVLNGQLSRRPVTETKSIPVRDVLRLVASGNDRDAIHGIDW